MITRQKKQGRKSNNQVNHRAGKLARERGHSAGPKAKTRTVKAGRKSLKASVGNKPQTAPKAREPETRGAIKTSKTAVAANQKSVTPQEKKLERGRRLKELHQEGHSLAELGRKIGGSRSLAQDLVALACLPRDLEGAYLQGKIGRKAALKSARARRAAVTKNPVVTSQQPLQKPTQNPVPVMTAKERERKISEGANLLVQWFRTTDMAPCDREMFWSQVNSALYGGLSWLFTDEAPNPGEINVNEDPWAVIKRSRVKSKNQASMADVLNDRVKELARWIQRVFPDRETREAVVDLARRRLLHGEQ